MTQTVRKNFTQSWPSVGALLAALWGLSGALSCARAAEAEYIPPPAYACVGDCNGRGSVGVDEVVRLIRIALGQSSADDCVSADGNGDGRVAIDDLIAGVKGALRGCNDGAQSQHVDEIIAPLTGDAAPAAAVLVVQNNHVVHRKVYGLANIETGEVATANNAFLLASISKPFTSLAVHHLVEQGRIALDDPVATYLPELARFGDDVTIRHLLQHTSGLPDYYFPPLWDALAAIEPFPTNTDGLNLLSMQGDALFAPGDQLYYLNGGFEALAVLVERVSGQRFTEFQQQLIFDPTGMRSSFSIPRPAREATAPYAYSYEQLPGGQFQRIEYDPSAYMYGSGDVVSNMDDLVRFDRAVFAGNIIGLDLLQEALVPARLNDGSEPTVPFEGETKYGYGWFISQVGDHPFVGHAGIYLGYRTYFAHFLDEDLTVIVLTANNYNPFLFTSDIVVPIADAYVSGSVDTE